MDECEDNLSAEEIQNGESSPAVRIKPKKRSLVERELETNLTARVTSPVTGEGTSTSRYGRARRSTHLSETEGEKVMKPLKIDTKPQPQAYKMHASNSPIRKDSPKRAISVASTIEDQIENIYNENMALSRFGSEELLKGQSPAKKFPKIYVRKDLTQKPEPDNIVLIKNLFSPDKSNTHLKNILERSSEKYSLNGHATSLNGFPDTSSVVKALDFDGKKKKKEVKEKLVSKNELFELEAACEYQVGDLAWARVGTYPFWPCIITREPFTDMFVKKKLFGRVEHEIIHVTFFGDNGRRGWIVDNMLRKYSGRAEFEAAREKFTPEAKKKDPRFYAAHFVSEKKLPLWNVSVEEAETILREPKRLRIDMLHDMLEKARLSKTTPKREKGGKITRTDSDVSLSESLYDTLFSEDDNKNDDNSRSKKLRRKSLDVSEVVTACLDNMAAKSGITKIQKQSHMDRWLQKAKSKTPEKSQPKLRIKNDIERKKDRIRKPKESRKPKLRKNESLSSEKNLLPYQNEHDYSSVNYENHDGSNIKTDFDEGGYNDTLNSSCIGIIAKVESLNGMEDCSQEDIITTVVNDDIVITDAENISKEIKVVNGDDNDKITAKGETQIGSVENNISSVEEKLTKDDPLKVEIPKTDNIQTRRSKRNQQSVDANDDKIVTNNVEETKVPSVVNGVSSTVIEEEQTNDESLKVPKTSIKTRHSKRKSQSVDANDDNKIITKDVEKTKVASVENSTSFTDMEEKPTKDEQTGIKTRHNKRKSQSVDANHDDKIISKHVEETKVASVENSISSTEIEEKPTEDEQTVMKTRHSKRKSLSVDANDYANDDKIITKDVEKTKVASVENSISSTEIEEKPIKDEQTVMKTSHSKRKSQSVDANHYPNDDDKIVTKDLEKTKIASVENSIRFTEIEEKPTKYEETEKTKDEPLKAGALKTDNIQTRRSKRKQQSVDANNDNTIITEKVEETKVSFVENSSAEIEEKLTKDEPLEVEVPKTDSIKTRRSKRKRQSLEDKNNSLVENKAKNPKLDLVESIIDIEINAKSNAVNSSIKLENTKNGLEHGRKVKEVLSGGGQFVVTSEVDKTNTIKNKTDTWYQNKQISMNGPKLVVVIEPLKMLSTKVMIKESIQMPKDMENDNSLLKNNDVNEMAVVKKTPFQLNEIEVSKEIILSRETEQLINFEQNLDHNDANAPVNGDPTEIKDKMDNKIIEATVAKNGMFCNGISHSSPKENNITDEIEVDDHETLNLKDQFIEIQSKAINSSLGTKVQPDTEDAADNHRNEVNNSPKLDSENKDKNEKEAIEGTRVVIGEEMYLFDRTLSQDYDEVCEDNFNENDSPPEEPENVAEQSYSSTKNDLNNDVALSQDYDEVSEHIDHSEKGKPIADLNDLSDEVRNDIVKDKIIEDMRNNDMTEKVNGHTKNDKEKDGNLDIEDSCQLTNDKGFNKDLLNDQENETCYLGNSKKNDNLDETLNERIEKKLKSPRLSLNRAKRNSERVDQKVQTKTNSENNSAESDNIASSDELNNESNNSKVDISNTDSNVVMKTDAENLKDKVVDTNEKEVNKISDFVETKESSLERNLKQEIDLDAASVKSEDSSISINRRKIRSKEKQSLKKAMDDPEFMKYLEFRQDALIDEQPELTQDEIISYLYQTWLYEESNKSDMKKTVEAQQSNIVKGLNTDPAPQPKKIRKKPKVEKEAKAEKEPNLDTKDIALKDKPKRKITQSKPYYNEDFSDLEEEDLETFSIFDTDVPAKNEDGEPIDEVELYFEKLTKPKPNVFKGYVRERVCEICERTENLVKCKACHGMFHVECVEKEVQIVEVPAPTRGRKKKKKSRGRKPKGYEDSIADSESQSDEKSQDANNSEELNVSLEDERESHITFDADYFETQWETKMNEVVPETVEGDFVSDQEIIWDAPPGQCEIVEMKHKEKPVDYSDFKCRDCQKHDTPVCFVCKSDKSPKGQETRQKCQVAHCHRYYHLECLEYWPQTQFNSWEPSKTNKKVIEYVEALSCPRHVCHTCVSDDPRGCKTRFCGDKLARCVRCPATYHSFTKCLPAGSQILTASQIICPRHYEHRPGKVPCHVNTGWCFICALGGTLICCEYCPTSFHAECLNIKPPEGSYMCEDCETGRLPLYGEMVWVKLGHYRWWPGIILHPTEIPDNIMAVKHSPGEFVVRFFGQYDHYWVNRGRVFPFQEGDSGKISSQKSKIDAAFTTAMEHAQRACEILKNIEPNEEEDMDIASSLLPPHYVKLKVNKPVGSLVVRRDIDSNSLTQCECDVSLPEPCGVYSHCLNRMLLTECGPLCRAGDRCNNRAFEKRLYPRLAAARTSSRGWGLKTLEDIKQGQFVIEYVGELIDEEEFRRRMCRKHEIRDENYYFLTLDKERMIDAGPKGNLARFMNHCCEPNCETQKWTVLGDVRVGLFAIRDIPANSELTFNYNLECAGIEKKRCLCGAKRCSGYIGAKPKQEEAQPKKIKGPGKRTYKKRKNVEDSPSTSKIKPPVKIKIKPIKPRELTEIEKDLLIIKNATNGMSSDSEGSRLSSVDERKDTKPLKRKRVSFSTEDGSGTGSSIKKTKLDDKVGD